jgi:hypothetical protein
VRNAMALCSAESSMRDDEGTAVDGGEAEEAMVEIFRGYQYGSCWSR